MERKSKSQPARKAAARPAAKRTSKPPKASGAKAVAKKAAAGKAPALKGAAARAGRSGPATKRAKPKNILAKTKKTAKSKVKSRPAATKPDRNSIAQNVPLIEALDQALSGPRPAAMSGERHGNGAPGLSGNPGGDQGRPPAWRPSLGESGPDSAEAPARTNKLVPTNAVHTTKRRMKRNTWQSPVLGLGAIATILAVLVLGNNNEPPDVSPLERRVEARPGAPLPQTAKTPRLQDPAQAAPERGPRIPSRLAQPAIPLNRGRGTAPGASQEPDSPRGLRVLELVEMERMLARLEMNPSQPDGVVDRQTETAIRTYQQIAGLPVDGEATPELLDDMREVVKMMDGTN